MNAIKINSKFDGKYSNSLAAVGLNVQAVFYVFFKLLVVFILTLEATVLKVIRIFLFQPVDNDNLVILNIFRYSHYLQINIFGQFQ